MRGRLGRRGLGWERGREECWNGEGKDGVIGVAKKCVEGFLGTDICVVLVCAGWILSILVCVLLVCAVWILGISTHILLVCINGVAVYTITTLL
jgi:hypothetical protein